MKFSEAWLREWVNPDVTTNELAEQLTMAGLEIDAIEPVAAKFDGVVVARILSASPHPDAKKLQICEVDAGEAKPLQIVCGAPNAREGLYAPLAKIGAYLPDDMRIKRAKLRGIESEGMLCSAKELGLLDEADGLMELPGNPVPGEDIRKTLELDDVSLELSLTPNRSDCLGIAGIAREVGVLFKQDLTKPIMKSVFVASKEIFPVHIDAKEDCPRYIGRVIQDINSEAETPLWMQERLRRSGLRSLGPAIDVTNYVLLELGQPMHAFDLDVLSDEVHVRHSNAGEQLTLLDGQTLILDAGTLVIADKEKILALAGVMGGQASAVSDKTRQLFLECAYFNPMAIAGKARQYGLHTDSSHRFERGVDPHLQHQAIERATELLCDIVGGQPGPLIETSHDDDLPQRNPVRLRNERIERMLGIPVDANFVTDCLTRLGMTVKEDKLGWTVIPPSFRFDINIEEDLVEEVGRIYGYANLPTRRPHARLHMGPRPEGRLHARRIQHLMVDLGYSEAMTYSFIDPDLAQQVEPNISPVALANPLSADMAAMRTSLWPGLIKALAHNQKRQHGRIRMFETGVKYLRQDAEIQEINVISGIATGTALPEQWGLDSREVDFYDVKSDVMALLALTGRQSEIIFIPTEHNALHPGQGADIVLEGNVIGRLGALHPELKQKQELIGEIFLFELLLETVTETLVPSFRALSRFPSIRRDIAIVVDEKITAHQVRECVKNAAGELLTNLQLFDVYTGKGIDLGKKSLALGLIFQGSSRTLNEEDVNAVMDEVLQALESNLNATLRE